MTTDTLALIPASAAVPVPHFAVPGVREMFMDEPQPCPAFPGLTFDGLTFDGLAVAPDGRRHYLMVTIRPPGKPALRAHLGPDPDTVAQHGLTLVAALRTHRSLPNDPGRDVALLSWLATCWLETAAELDDATGTSDEHPEPDVASIPAAAAPRHTVAGAT